jgi:hypothetical protein
MQDNQDEVGEAGSDPETSEPADCVKRLPRLQTRARIQKNQLDSTFFL